MNVNFILNGEDISIQAHAQEKSSLLLRKRCGITSLYTDCSEGLCGRCLVIFNGQPANSCLIPAFRLRGSEIITYEGIEQTGNAALLREAFKMHELSLCSFCRASRYILLSFILDYAIRPDADKIKTILASVSCRCISGTVLLDIAQTALDIKEGRLQRYANK